MTKGHVFILKGGRGWDARPHNQQEDLSQQGGISSTSLGPPMWEAHVGNGSATKHGLSDANLHHRLRRRRQQRVLGGCSVARASFSDQSIVARGGLIGMSIIRAMFGSW